MKNHESDSIRSAECLKKKTYSNLPPVVKYGYYATYLVARACNEIHVHVTSGLYDKTEHQSSLLCTFVWEWSLLLVARYALLVVFKPTIVDARQ